MTTSDGPGTAARASLLVLTTLLGAWMGGVLVLFVATSTLFADADLGSKAAGNLAGAMLAKFGVATLVAVPALLAANAGVSFALRQSHPVKTLRWIAVVLLCGSAMFQTLLWRPLLVRLRDRIHGTPAPENLDELKRRFGKIHGIAMAGMSLDVVWCAAGLGLTFLARERRRVEDEAVAAGDGSPRADDGDDATG